MSNLFGFGDDPIDPQLLNDPFFEVYATYLNERDITKDREPWTGPEAADKLLRSLKEARLSKAVEDTDNFNMLWEMACFWLLDAKTSFEGGPQDLPMLYTTLLYVDIFKSCDIPRTIISMDVRAVCRLYWRAITVTRLAHYRKQGYGCEVESTSLANIFEEEMARFRFTQEKLEEHRNLKGYGKWVKKLSKVMDPSLEDTTRVFSR